MYAPVFEIKDSYIVKHKLNYNTSYDFGYYDENKIFISYKQKMMFVDYGLARKILDNNAENFDSIIIGNEKNNYNLLAFNYLNDNFILKLDGDLTYENKWLNYSSIKNIIISGETYQDFNITGTTTLISSQNANANVEIFSYYNNVKTTILNYNSEIYLVSGNIIRLGNYINENYFKSFFKDDTIYFKITNLKDNTYIINKWETNFNVSNINLPIKKQKFIISDYNNDLEINDDITIEIYKKTVETGTINWEYISSYIGETWFESGLTSSGKQWILTGSTTAIGYENGIKDWSLIEIEPLLKYNTNIINIENNIIEIDGKIDLDLFNNYSSYDNVYFKIISNNHCENNFSSVVNKLKYYKYYDMFSYNITYNSLTITPIKNSKDIYFNYDKINIYLSTGEFVGDIGDIYVESGYTTQGYSIENDIKTYKFITNNIYNKYTLEIFLNQFTGSTTNIYINGYSLIDNTDSLYGDYYITTNIDNVSNFKPYTYVKCYTDSNNYYFILITDITENKITFVKPYNYLSDELILSINNITTIADISDILDKLYENYNHNYYNKISYDDKQKVYNTYANILNIGIYNRWLRILTTGIIFQNDKNIMILKIFDPTDFTDNRLTYIPSEIMRLGKDKKTSIPVIIDNYSIGLSSHVINSNTDNENIDFSPMYVFNSNLDNILLVINANLT